MDENVTIAVVGAGVVGLSTALSLQREFSSANITVFADKLESETLSSGAGGLFRPEINVHEDSERVRKWCEASLDHFLKILKSSEAAEAGMQLVSGYQLSSTPSSTQNSLLRKLLPDFRELQEKELEKFPQNFKGGVFFTTVITDCRYYLSWLKSKFQQAGGEVIVKHISNLCEIPNDFDIVVNCTGLGAKQLMQDDMLIPVRGQTIRVKAPWIKHFYYGNGVYIIPGVDYVTLGGVKDFGSWDMDVNPYQKQFIWDKCTELVPSLKEAKIERDWVGLRPYRPCVCVDASFIRCSGGYKMVVNNYGHGGHGVSLSWGTAQEVTQIVKNLLSEKNFPISKL